MSVLILSDMSEMILDIQYTTERTTCVTGILSHSAPHNSEPNDRQSAAVGIELCSPKHCDIYVVVTDPTHFSKPPART